MKKRIVVFVLVIMLALVCAVSPAMAAVSESNRGTALRIDNQTQYMGMDSTYRDGYSPTVSDGQAHIILPLIASGGSQQVKAGEPINVSVNLGDPQKAPFVFNNYNEKVALQNNKLADGTTNTVQSYLVSLNLPLSADRVNGNYPVVITAKYPIADGTIKMQEFTVFVKITDGQDPSGPSPEPTAEPTEPVQPGDPGDGGGSGGSGGGGGGTGGPTSQPKVIISNYQISPDPVNAGEAFSVTVTLENTSKSVTVKNITVTFKSQTTDLMPGDNTNTAYIEKIAPKKTADFTFTMAARADAKAGPQKIDIAIAYEDNQAAQLTATDEISVEVHQKIRLEYDPPKFPSQVYMGDTTSASLNLYNKGKNTLYNVTVTLEVPGLTPESSAFLGNMESGTAKTADIYASVAPDPNAGMDGAAGADGGAVAYGDKMVSSGDVSMIGGADAATDINISSDGMAGREKEGEQIGGGLSPEAGGMDEGMIQPGPVEGNFVVTYEDEYGEEYEIRVPVSTELVPMPDYGGGMEPGEEIPVEPQGFPWWGWVIIAGGVAAVVIVVVVRKKKKKREQELQEQKDDDDIL
ncbi:MAG: hypothetical protein VB081_00925 [Christensenella sp.]|uniref:COG1361 S-layer family protein n=1 Tax=Christensenella sp. TaxID=1935934 RepID=UPI002B21554F|nr:hypothetical protein [Christensenella sp.]MEA5002053.1 hypothetical protein [Christensenella sp.]